MKVQFGEEIDRQDSGKHKFLSRLSIEFKKKGIQIVNKNADIFLHIGRNIEKSSAKKIVMRADGLILNSDQPFEKMNKKILKHINSSDGIIYQGQFCKEAFEKFLGIQKYSVIISNGADPDEFLPRNPQNFFLTHCNWRPHKRLKNICEGFFNAQEKGLDSRLFVAGEIEPPVKHKKIKYLGWVKQPQLKELLSQAIATIHLAWLDWCPNAMIESIIAGCPVIYSTSGGSSAVAFSSGIPIKDVDWDFKPCRLYKPPKLDVDQIASAMISLKTNTFQMPKRDDLYIENVAQKYIKFFESLL